MIDGNINSLSSSSFLVDDMDLSLIIPEFIVTKSWNTRRKKNPDIESQASENEGITIVRMKIKTPLVCMLLSSFYVASEQYMRDILRVDPNEIILVGTTRHTNRKPRLMHGETIMFGSKKAYYVTARYPSKSVSYKVMEGSVDIILASGTVLDMEPSEHFRSHLVEIEYPLIAYEVSRQNGTLDEFVQYYKKIEAIVKE